MSLFQLGVASVGLLFLILTVLAVVRGALIRREGLIGTIIWITMVLAVMLPEALSRVAKIVGIGRGADLLLYCAVVAMIIGFIMVYVRLRQLQREITLLVREIALRDAVSGIGTTEGKQDHRITGASKNPEQPK